MCPPLRARSTPSWLSAGCSSLLSPPLLVRVEGCAHPELGVLHSVAGGGTRPPVRGLLSPSCVRAGVCLPAAAPSRRRVCLFPPCGWCRWLGWCLPPSAPVSGVFVVGGGVGCVPPLLLFVGGVVFSPRCPLCRASSLSVGGVGRVPPPCSTSPSRSRLVVVGGGAGRVPPRAQPHRVGQGWSRDGG